MWGSNEPLIVMTFPHPVKSNILLVTVHSQCHLLKQKIIQKLRLETEMRST